MSGTLFLTNGMSLGSRLIGYEFYDSESKGFVGMSESQIKKAILNKKAIRGFIINENGELELDYENMRYSNIQMKSGVNKLSWKYEKTDRFTANASLIVVGKRKAFGKNMYEVVGPTHARIECDESKLLLLYQFCDVYGIIVGDDEIKLCTDIIREKELALEIEKRNEELARAKEKEEEAEEQGEDTADDEESESEK